MWWSEQKNMDKLKVKKAGLMCSELFAALCLAKLRNFGLFNSVTYVKQQFILNCFNVIVTEIEYICYNNQKIQTTMYWKWVRTKFILDNLQCLKELGD